MHLGYAIHQCRVPIIVEQPGLDVARPPPRRQPCVPARRAPQRPRRQPGLDVDRIRAYRRHGCTYRSKKPSRLSAKTWPGGLRSSQDRPTLPRNGERGNLTAAPPSSTPLSFYTAVVLTPRVAQHHHDTRPGSHVALRPRPTAPPGSSHRQPCRSQRRPTRPRRRARTGVVTLPMHMRLAVDAGVACGRPRDSAVRCDGHIRAVPDPRPTAMSAAGRQWRAPRHRRHRRPLGAARAGHRHQPPRGRPDVA